MANKLNAKIGKAVVVKEGPSDLRGMWPIQNQSTNNIAAPLSLTSADTIDNTSSVAAGALKVSSTVTVIFEMID